MKQTFRKCGLLGDPSSESNPIQTTSSLRSKRGPQKRKKGGMSVPEAGQGKCLLCAFTRKHSLHKSTSQARSKDTYLSDGVGCLSGLDLCTHCIRVQNSARQTLPKLIDAGNWRGAGRLRVWKPVAESIVCIGFLTRSTSRICVNRAIAKRHLLKKAALLVVFRRPKRHPGEEISSCQEATGLKYCIWQTFECGQKVQEQERCPNLSRYS